MAGRKFVLGDIHGAFEALEKVFIAAGFDFEQDQLIQLGDICDRGPQSYEVVEFLKHCSQLILIEGNHDQWFKNYLDSNLHEIDFGWLEQGGEATLDSYTRHKINPRTHEAFYLTQVPYYIDESNNLFIHGGFERHRRIVDQDPRRFAWDRNLVYDMMVSDADVKLKTADNFNHIFIGHTPTLNWNKTTPITRCGVTNVDTGSGKGGMLTMMDIETREIWQSPVN